MSLRDILGGEAPQRRRDRESGAQLYPATGMLGFDVVASMFYGAPATLQPVLLNVYTVPDGVTRAVVTALAVTGWPYAFWLNRASWSVKIQGAGAQEYKTESILKDTANTVLCSGMRWCPMGSLPRPQEVQIQLKPSQTLQIAVITQTGLTRAITTYVRAQGVLFTQ